MRRLAGLALAALGLLTATAEGRTVRLDGPAGALLSEAHLAVSPTERRNVIVVAKDVVDGTPALDAFASFDGGRSFAGGHALAGSYLGAPAAGTDPVVVFDRAGRGFFSQLVLRDLPGRGAESIVGVQRTDDGGRSFEPPVVAASERFSGGPVDGFGPFDKEWLAAAADGALHAAWVRLARGAEGGSVAVAASRDGGASFSRPRRISSLRRRALGPQVAVQPDGTVHVAWASFRRKASERTGTVLHARSRDGGRTFSSPRRVARFANGLAAYKLVALRASPRGRSLLACWSQGRGRESRAVCARSHTGARWSRPRQVAPRARGAHDLVAIAGQGRRRFWISLYVRGRRATAVRLYRSDDGGRSFRLHRTLARRPYRLTSFVGDYTGLDAGGGRIYTAYVLPRGGPRSRNAIYVSSLAAR